MEIYPALVVDILLVEDDPRDAELIDRAIKQHHIANPLHVVEDGAEALDFLFCRGKYGSRSFSQKPKVVFLDLRLPKVSGLDVLREVKADPRTASLPVVIVTSSREDPDISAAYELGVNSYVVKPVEIDDFFKVMSRLGLYWLLVNQSPH